MIAAPPHALAKTHKGRARARVLPSGGTYCLRANETGPLQELLSGLNRMLPGDQKLRIGQANVKRAVLCSSMSHRNLRVPPHTSDCIPICVPDAVAVLQKRDQIFPDQ